MTTIDRPATTPGLNVAVVIDDEVVRCGFGAMLRNLDVVLDVEEYRDGADLSILERVDKLDVLVVGQPTSDQDRELIDSACHNGLKVLVVLDASEVCELSWASAITAHGLVRQQGLTAGRLDDMLLGLVDGQVFMPSDLAQKLFSHAGYVAALTADGESPGRGRRPVALTPREQEALSLLAHGLVNKQIARRLRISEHGVKRLVANILAKLGCSNRTLAVAIALQKGLVKPSTTPVADVA
jgi:two-component system nitrate/nitrite response regulator NarL